MRSFFPESTVFKESISVLGSFSHYNIEDLKKKHTHTQKVNKKKIFCLINLSANLFYLASGLFFPNPGIYTSDDDLLILPFYNF
jgi:hypothetical protein